MNLVMQIFSKKQLILIEQCQILGNATSDSRCCQAGALPGDPDSRGHRFKDELAYSCRSSRTEKSNQALCLKGNLCIGSQICWIASRSSSVVNAVCTTEVSCVQRDLPNPGPVVASNLQLGWSMLQLFKWDPGLRKGQWHPGQIWVEAISAVAAAHTIFVLGLLILGELKSHNPSLSFIY